MEAEAYRRLTKLGLDAHGRRGEDVPPRSRSALFLQVFTVQELISFLELEIEWHQVRLALAEMIHFIRQVQAYCQLEVIECRWKALIEFINKKEGDLDSLIAAHGDYVKQVVQKLLLRHPKAGKEVIHTSEWQRFISHY